MKTYRIRPLPWECVRPAGHEDGEWWYAPNTIFGMIQVYENHWSYCVDEYYDEGGGKCESCQDGMSKAEEWYVSRLMPAIEEVQT